MKILKRRRGVGNVGTKMKMRRGDYQVKKLLDQLIK
jgi:hypothetical protein